MEVGVRPGRWSIGHVALPIMDPAGLVIRPETGDDHGAIGLVVAAAFGSEAEAELVERIRASVGYVPDLAMVAEIPAERAGVNGGIVGYVMVSGAVIRPARTGSVDRPVLMLSPLAVDPDWQGQGIGGALVRAVTAEAERRGAPFVILEGSPVYYQRFGFQPAASYDLTLPLPEWAAPEAAQLLPLAGFDPADPELGGIVLYPAAFDGLG